MPTLRPNRFSGTISRAAVVMAVGGLVSWMAPVATASARTPEDAPSQHSDANAAMDPADSQANWPKHETLDERITSLQKSLAITQDEEAQWQDVAQTMRDNEAGMQKLAAARSETPPDNVTAVDDLKDYQAFAQAHVDGLSKLTVSFGKLYDEMPAKQQKRADEVFAAFGHKMMHKQQ